MSFRREAAPVWVTYRTGRTGTRPPEGEGTAGRVSAGLPGAGKAGETRKKVSGN